MLIPARKQATIDYDNATKLGLTNINRWQQGTPHHPMSERLVRFIAKHDFNDYNDYFCWKIGGDGDNGETLMYQIDAFFEMLDKTNFNPINMTNYTWPEKQQITVSPTGNNKQTGFILNETIGITITNNNATWRLTPWYKKIFNILYWKHLLKQLK